MAPVSVKISFRYGSHLPVVLRAVNKTAGSVLELGAGFFSTPVLHALCTLQKRQLLTLENNHRWYRWFKVYSNSYHEIDFVDDWAKAKIDRPWDVAIVDHSPDFRRIEEVKRLANLVQYIIIHDSNPKYNRNFHYDQIYHLFKYKFVYDRDEPSTTVLSNFVKLDRFIEHE